jgi:hypothetical protein
VSERPTLTTSPGSPPGPIARRVSYAVTEVPVLIPNFTSSRASTDCLSRADCDLRHRHTRIAEAAVVELPPELGARGHAMTRVDRLGRPRFQSQSNISRRDALIPYAVAAEGGICLGR